MSVNLVSPGDSELNVPLITNLELSYTGDLLPWEFWVNDEKKIEYPIGGTWDGSVNPSQMGYPNGQLDEDTNYNWYVRYAYYAETKTWVDDHWEFTGLLYDTAGPREFITCEIPDSITPSPSDTGIGDSFRIEHSYTRPTEDPDGNPITPNVDIWFSKVGEALVKIYSNTNTSSFGRCLEEDDTQYQWRIDAIMPGWGTGTGSVWTYTTEFEATAGKSTNPDPAHEESGVPLDKAKLDWDATSNPTSSFYNVWFGELGNMELVSSFQGATEWNIPPGTLEDGKIYEWRIIAYNVCGWTDGDTWNFNTGNPPGAPINPAPTAEEEDVDLFLSKLSWESGSGPEAPPETYDVWFGEIGEALVKIGSNLEETEFPLPDTLYALSNYHWRVDATNESATTTGDVWYFSTLVFGGYGYVRIGFPLSEGADFRSDIISGGFLYTSGVGHTSETSTFATVRKINPDTGEVIWAALPLGSSLFPGKLCLKGNYLYTAGPSYPIKMNESDGAVVKSYDNIYGGNGVAVDYNNRIFGCGITRVGKNIWRSNDAGDSEISAAIGAGTLYDVQVIRISGTDYIFVCGDYDAGQDCDVWKLDTGLNILETYKSGGDSNRIVRIGTENFLFVLHSKADDGSGVQCHVTALNFSLVVQDRILLDIDKEYKDFDRLQASISRNMNPADIIQDIVTNKLYGGGIANSIIHSPALGVVFDHCAANGIGLSIRMDNAKALLAWLDYIQSHYCGYARLG